MYHVLIVNDIVIPSYEQIVRWRSIFNLNVACHGRISYACFQKGRLLWEEFKRYGAMRETHWRMNDFLKANHPFWQAVIFHLSENSDPRDPGKHFHSPWPHVAVITCNLWNALPSFDPQIWNFAGASGHHRSVRALITITLHWIRFEGPIWIHDPAWSLNTNLHLKSQISNLRYHQMHSAGDDPEIQSLHSLSP
jgi:hypothetical protein